MARGQGGEPNDSPLDDYRVKAESVVICCAAESVVELPDLVARRGWVGPRLTPSINTSGCGGCTPHLAAVGQGSVGVVREPVRVDLETGITGGRA